MVEKLEKKKKSEPTMTEDERYEQLRRMSDEEKMEVFRGLTIPAHKNACKIIDASGQKPEDYSPQTKKRVTVLIYGMLLAMFAKNLGRCELRWIYAVFESIAKMYLYMGGEIERTGFWKVMMEQCYEQNPKYDVNIAQLVQEGINSYSLLDRPEELAKTVRQILQAYKEVPDTGWECTAIDLHYDSLTEAEQDRLDEERYAEKRNMPEEQKKKIRLSITEEAEAMIEKIVAASGEKPSELTPVTQECMAAMIYGAMCASSVEKLGCVDWDWMDYQGPVLINQFLGEDIHDAIETVKYFRRNDRYKNNPNLYPEIYKLIRFGMDTYPCVDQPEQLKERIRSMMRQCRELYET